MELHHSRHHKAYVDGANTALDKLAEARESGDNAAINLLEKNLAFNLGGHINHTVFWNNLSPDGGGQPDGERSEERRVGKECRSRGTAEQITKKSGDERRTGRTD